MMVLRRSISPHSVKYLPQRTCLACRQIKAKQELVRLVPVADKGIEVDVSGKKVGRGAYLCRLAACWDIGLKGSRLEHSLKVALSPANRGQLIRFGQSFLKEPVGGQSQATK